MCPQPPFSDIGKKQVPVLCGIDDLGPLYWREYLRKDVDFKPAALQMDDGTLDFWLLR
jgi:hypothetical protein